MLFRPNYCANCGEKIERVDWHLWTSRRFCELCETEFKGIDLIPKAVAVIGILGIAFGISGYVGKGPNIPDAGQVRQFRQTQAPAQVSNAGPTVRSQTASQIEQPSADNANPNTKQPAESKPVVSANRESQDGPVYICGAQTKKGTPCSRRVRGNVRCFQHTGMPAMLPPEKLRVG